MEGPGITMDKHLRDPWVLVATTAALEKPAMVLCIMALENHSQDPNYIPQFSQMTCLTHGREKFKICVSCGVKG